MEPANGIAADGTLPHSNEQVQEVWTGTTFSVAALMLGDGMKDEAYRTAWGLYHVSYRDEGILVRTPEAWDVTRQLPRVHVYASCGDLGDGNDGAGAYGVTAAVAKIPEK